jgi:hypothetical protein
MYVFDKQYLFYTFRRIDELLIKLYFDRRNVFWQT